MPGRTQRKMDLSGGSCTGLQEPKSLMKMGLCMVLVGHVNFLLAALVHGTVLRHVGYNTSTVEHAISNILALAAGLVGVLVGILAIIFSKNEKNRVLTWWLCMLSAVGGVLAAASVIGLLIALVWTLIYGTKGLLLHCNLPVDRSYFSITFECPFDPTRIYGTTLILWVPLIVMSVVELVICVRSCAVSIRFIRRKTRINRETRPVKTLEAAVPPVFPDRVPTPRRCYRDCEMVRPPNSMSCCEHHGPTAPVAQPRTEQPRFDSKEPHLTGPASGSDHRPFV